jgi:hypothetical protein
MCEEKCNLTNHVQEHHLLEQGWNTKKANKSSNNVLKGTGVVAIASINKNEAISVAYTKYISDPGIVDYLDEEDYAIALQTKYIRFPNFVTAKNNTLRASYADVDNLAMFINHSLTPNTKVVFHFPKNSEPTAVYIATEKIEKGAEVTSHYGISYDIQLNMFAPWLYVDQSTVEKAHLLVDGNCSKCGKRMRGKKSIDRFVHFRDCEYGELPCEFKCIDEDGQIKKFSYGGLKNHDQSKQHLDHGMDLQDFVNGYGRELLMSIHERAMFSKVESAKLMEYPWSGTFLLLAGL